MRLCVLFMIAAIDADADAAASLALRSRELALRQLSNYTAAWNVSCNEGKLLVIAVNCDPPVGEWIGCRVEEYNGSSTPRIIVGRPKDGWGTVLSCHATAAEIRAALGNVHAPATNSAPARHYYFPSRMSRGGC